MGRCDDVLFVDNRTAANDTLRRHIHDAAHERKLIDVCCDSADDSWLHTNTHTHTPNDIISSTGFQTCSSIRKDLRVCEDRTDIAARMMDEQPSAGRRGAEETGRVVALETGKEDAEIGVDMAAVVAEERCMVAVMTAERAVALVGISTEASLANNCKKTCTLGAKIIESGSPNSLVLEMVETLGTVETVPGLVADNMAAIQTVAIQMAANQTVAIHMAANQTVATDTAELETAAMRWVRVGSVHCKLGTHFRDSAVRRCSRHSMDNKLVPLPAAAEPDDTAAAVVDRVDSSVVAEPDLMAARALDKCWQVWLGSALEAQLLAQEPHLAWLVFDRRKCRPWYSKPFSML